MSMRRGFVAVLSCFALSLPLAASAAQVRSLAFEDRVRAQEAIERVYFGHQIGVTRSFEEVVTREVLERKVRTYLEQSVALERVWDRRVTSESLKLEWDRIVQHTQYPERLREIADALDWDPLLLLECVARPALVNRLVGDLYAYDERLHAETRSEAERVRALLVEGDFEAAASRALLHEVHLKRVSGTASSQGAMRSTADDPTRAEVLALDAGTYRARRSRAPASVGQVGEIIEQRAAFEIRIVQEEGADHARIASYLVPKRERDPWWKATRGSFDGGVAPPLVELTAEELRQEAEGFLGFAGAFDPSCVPDDTWDNGILEDPNPARDGHSAVWTGTEMITWGGGGLDSGMRYDPLLDVFTPTSRESAPSPRSFHTAVWSGGEMIVWGGWPLSTTGGRYDPVQDAWTPTATDHAPAGRFDHTAVWTGYAMIVWGGTTDGSTRLDSGARYYPASDAWVAVAGAYAPSARDRHTAVWTGSEMIVWGGRAPSFVNNGARYNPISDQWTAVSITGAASARADHIALWTGTQMIIWGGTSISGTNSTGSRYDPVANNWTAITNTGAPVAGGGEVAVWTGSVMIVWRGTVPSAQGRYSPSSNTWSPMSTGPNAPAALSTTAVWTGDEMIVWSPADGGRYDPQSNSWSPTLQLTLADGPSDRSGHTSVWTGSHMIVWGGPPSADPLGSRYDPLLETWTAVSSVGAPAPRSGHTAVWTGDRMIVWGGAATGVLQDSGGRYDPLGDSWLTTAALDAPQAREGHVAVWTGSRMLIWGGFVGGNPLTQAGCEMAHTATGASYSPDTNSWSSMTTSGAPGSRGAHTAVWSGDEMLVWGGRHWVWNTVCTQDVAVADGSRYDPDLNSWTPIASSGSPSARFGHTAVWTGDAMVVWGGEVGSSMLDTGGQYAPLADSWVPTALEGAPAPRSGHTAVWTGDEMIVWGGGAFLDSGGRYQPDWDIWRATSLAGAPAPRDGHTAIWTGDLMIVWGGSEPLGGRYAAGHPDNDGDGLADGCLACPNGPADDSDGDGHACSSDNCPFESNPSQGDDDSDGWGDACDPCLGDPVNDADNDLVCDGLDNCPGAYNPGQSNADGDGAGDACDGNDDNDSLADAMDNCRDVSNNGQEDLDGDGAGDACDACRWDADDDADGDALCGSVDNCPATPNPTQRDADEDLAGDACDICPSDPDDSVVGDGLCFAPQVVYPVGSRPQSIAAGDVDRDGFDDLATANLSAFTSTRLPNNGDGSFGQATTAAVREQPVFIRTADFNLDGFSDHVVVNSQWNPPPAIPGSISVFLSTGSGFMARKDYGVGLNPRSVAIADYDRDGDLDLMVANQESSTLSYVIGTAFGNFYAPIPFATQLNRKPELVLTGDFNNDQIADLAVSIVSSPLLQVYRGTGANSFVFVGEESAGGGRFITSHAVGDFNEDHTLDLAVAHTNETQTNSRVLILTGTGTGDFVFGAEIVAGRASKSLEVGDFNQDGHADLVMTNPADWNLSVLTGNGNLTFGTDVRFPVRVSPSAVTIGNLTGDGRHSLAAANIVSDEVSVLLNLGPIGAKPPVADAGPNGIWNVPADSPAGATVTLDGSGSTDPDSTPGTADDIVLYEWIKNFGQSNQLFLGDGETLEVFLPNFTSKIALRTTDRTGLSDIDFVTVTVVQEQFYPDLALVFTPPTLWPPNHRVVPIQVSVIPEPTCMTPTAILSAVSSTEDPDAPGTADGDTAVDIAGASLGTADFTFSLRAERSALTPGRTYYVTYTVSCQPNSSWPLQFWFKVPFEQDGTAEPLQILLDEVDEGTLVSWAPVEGAQHYDVIRGSLGNLQVLEDAYDVGQVTCIEASSTDESTEGFEDPAEPLPGETFFYLVRYHDGDDSGYGTESAAKPRIPSGGDCR